MKQIDDIRTEYKGAILSEDQVDPSPFLQFKNWFQEAMDSEIYDPNAMSLSTVSASGIPSLRTVLLKAYDEKGFVFYTNYGSRKALEIENNQNVALLFPWYKLSRQLIIQGTAEKISKAESAKYFLTRPFGSQLGAWVSSQSQVISGRKLLEMKFQEMKRKFKEGKIPVPDNWGGMRVRPFAIEFWQGQPNRLHDRILYTLQSDSSWKIERLAP